MSADTDGKPPEGEPQPKSVADLDRERGDIFDDMDCRPPPDEVDEERLARLTPKHMRERAEIFDDMDCRPGPSNLDPEYSDSLIPEHMRERIMEIRRKRREAEAARGKPMATTMKKH